ncbi:hypothetical protein Hanom_Chr14g01298171 [Helianthus anomalus]
MRAESVEAMVAAEVKLVDARTMMDDAIKKMTKANSKMQVAESIFQRSSLLKYSIYISFGLLKWLFVRYIELDM